jgi:hypothetical protein
LLQRHYIRLVFFLTLFGAVSPLRANDPPPATPEQERLNALVNEGVLPRTALAKAARERESERLEGIVRDTLTNSQLLAGKIPEMMRAVTTLRDMAREDLANALKLAEAGALPLQQLEKVKDASALAERRFELAEKRAQLVRDLALMARAEGRVDELRDEDLAFDYVSESEDWREQILSVDAAFFHEFGRGLPVSAEGATLLHRSLGYDHTDRVDVALHPDDPEGLFVIELLYEWDIPFIAFRSSVPGQSTGPHIHIGPRSDPIPEEDL